MDGYEPENSAPTEKTNASPLIAGSTDETLIGFDNVVAGRINRITPLAFAAPGPTPGTVVMRSEMLNFLYLQYERFLGADGFIILRAMSERYFLVNS